MMILRKLLLKLLLPVSLFAQTGNLTVTGTIAIVGSITVTSDAEAADTNEEAIYAVGATMLRPDKIKWKLGSYGTFTPSERIYAKVINITRIGASSNNYEAAYSKELLECTPFAAGSNIVAHNAQGVLCYVTETDVAAVVNPKKTFMRMRKWILRDSEPVTVQAEINGTPLGTATTTFTPGTYGSIVLEIETQSYSVAVQGRVSSTDYNAIVGYFGGITVDGTANQAVHLGYGKLPVYLPVKASMDGNSFTWKLYVQAGYSNYSGFVTARIADLPSWWNDDVP